MSSEKREKRENPSEISQAIKACISIGPGRMTNFSVNGVIIFKTITWKKYCIIDATYGGLIADNIPKKQFYPTDVWSADVMENHIVINSVDSSRLVDPKKTKKKTAVPGEIINV